MSIQTSNNKINSLQGLRVIAFLGVFLAHSEIIKFGPLGIQSVSIFFVLSGFVMLLSYYKKNRFQDISIKGNLLFAWNKVRGLYPLHILTTILMLVFLVKSDADHHLLLLFVKLLLNIFLIQEWFPLANASISGVSWYLSVSLFCYFLFPYLLHALEKIRNKKDVLLLLILLFEFQFILGLLVSTISTPNDSTGWFTNDYTYWLTYKFPPLRLFDFIIGTCLGLLYKLSLGDQNSLPVGTSDSRSSLLSEFKIISVLILSALLEIFVLSSTAAHLFLPNDNSHWWTTAFLYSIPSCLIIWLTATGNSFWSRWLASNRMIKLADYTKYAFLIHFTVFTYLGVLTKLLFGKKFYSLYGSCIKITIGMVLTIFLSVLTDQIIRKKGHS